jgi:hypothetical protein
MIDFFVNFPSLHRKSVLRYYDNTKGKQYDLIDSEDVWTYCVDKQCMLEGIHALRDFLCNEYANDSGYSEAIRGAIEKFIKDYDLEVEDNE